MERRLLLVFALTFLVMIFFQPLLKKYLPQAPSPAPQKQSQTAAPPPNPPAEAPQPKAPAAIPATATKQSSAESETVIENDLYRITFSNRGAQVKSWVLKHFDDDLGKPLDLVNTAAAAKYGYPLSLWVYDQALRNKLNSVLYLAGVGRSALPGGEQPNRSVTPNMVDLRGQQSLAAPAEITFEFADPEVTVRKTFRFDRTYVVRVETSVAARGSQISALPIWPAGIGDETSLTSYHSSQIEYQHGGTTERLAIKKISSGNTITIPFNWAAVTDSYFAAAFIPEDPQSAALVTLRNSLDIPKDPKKPNPQETVSVDVLGVAAGNLKGPTIERIYAGPKSLQVMESVPVPTISGAPQDLRAVIDFGFFGMIARPLFLWLKWTHEKLVHNWGWAIVLQTLIINIALLPLRISSMKSMLKMQRIQPQIKSIQEKYKKYSMRDPRKQEMNKEIMDLQKKAGVNPVGGCLPMIIQLPFLFAYYAMLRSVLELRHAPWLWIHDLSSPDPYYLLPIGIMISMLIMQRMTPQTGMDPTQQKMMTFMMPIMMGVLSFNLAAGLCLYWSEGNLIGIAQQAIMNRTSLGREMREIAAKRARKKDKST